MSSSTKKLKNQIKKQGGHFGLKVTEMNEKENFVVFNFTPDYCEIDADVGITIIRKKPVTLTRHDMIDEPIFHKVLKENPAFQDKVYVFSIKELINKSKNPHIMVYRKDFRDNAIIQAMINSFNDETEKKLDSFISEVISSKQLFEKVETYIIGYLFGYPDKDIMAYINNWGYKKKSGVKYMIPNISQKNEEFKKIKKLAIRILQKIKKSDFFEKYKAKAEKIEKKLCDVIDQQKK